MSRRLLQRGRYPKGPGIDQITNPNAQFPQTTLAQCPVSSDVPYFTSVQSQHPQNVWNHPSYSNPSTYQQNQAPPPVPESNTYWSSGHTYSTQAQQPNDPWNWPTENYQQHPQQSSYIQEHQSSYVPEQPSGYLQEQHPNYLQQQPNYQQHQQSNYQQSSYQQQQQEQPNYLQQQQPQQQNQQSVGLPADAWQQSIQTQPENQNFVPQSVNFDSSTLSTQPVNSNYNNVSLDSSLQSWETDSLNITQPAHLPWTYSAPQYLNQTSNLSTEFSSSCTSSNEFWNSNSLTAKSETSNQSQIDSKSNDTVQNGAVSLESNISENYSTDESKDSVASNHVPNCENVKTNEGLVIDADYENSSLSAFFQNSEPNNSANSESGGISTPDIQDNIDTASLDENLSQLQINESERSSVVTEGEQGDHNLEDTDDGGNQEVHFIQEEENHIIEALSQSDSVTGFSEEPGNQEVPEPNIDLSLNSSQAQLNQDYHEMSPEEPLNQQIPIESGEKSRLSSERERVVIRPREESPFKPPRINSNSKGIIVQKEAPIQNIKENKQCKEKTVVHEVNLETFPDNLERPPDYEELKKQSSFYASHQKHLRTELNSSPSSLLCDNPDIPCVTLAPAAPPINSSAKSDKSESSSDSKREMASFANSKNLTKESNKSSPAGIDSDFSEKSLNANKSNSLKDEKHFINRNYSSLSNQEFSNMQSEQQPPPPHPYLKDSKIEDVRNSEIFRKSASNIENLQNPRSKQNYNSASHSEYSLSKVKSADLKYPPEYSHKKNVDKKYPSFEDRQYFSDRERSRPSSRSSMDDRSEDYRYPPRPGDFYGTQDDRRRGQPDYARPPSRSSESDMNRSDRHNQYDYYKGQYPYNAAYSRNQDYYQRPPNYRGYEYDQYSRDPYYASYYDAYRYAYSNYNYGFYDELYRNDPRYRQYREEQYRQYYAKYGYEGDFDRSSAHSGRSSANELAKDMNSTHYLEHDVDSNLSEISSYNIRQDYSYDDIPNDMSLSTADHSSTPSQRLTPVKFSYPHPIVRFSTGGLLITALPSPVNPTLVAPVKIQSMQMIMENQESYHELKNYQGPLVRGLTHKNDVIDFCNQKIKFLRQKDDIVDRDSYILLWELMILLLRQNGAVAGSDIAELLLKDHEVLRPHAVPLKHNIETPQGEHSPADVNDSSSQFHAGDTSSPDEGIVVLHDKTSLNMSKTVDVDKVTRKFREFLLFGHKKDALEWAMKHGLWGHALFLASKMDLRTYANVMTRFANSLALNDPLQTLYQLMSGRQPSAVTCVADKKWGDWRPHLAMILSNPSNLPDVDSRSITTLGDTLASRGCLPAAQFCYIMAQVEFGTFEQKNSKLVLLTADHRLCFEEFATNEAIQCTEIYEYAQSLANPSYLLVHLQMYKFLYALRLVEHGFLEEALHYCEVIAGNIQAHTSLFPYDLISEIYKLASRLKYHDPHFLRGQGEYEDQDDPDWLKNLAVLVHNYNNVMQDHNNSEIQYDHQSELNQTVNDQVSPITDNVAYQNVSPPGMQTDITNSLNNIGYYQQNNVGVSWNPQSALPNTVNLSNNQQESHSYYQSELINNQSSFQLDSSMPSHEENETTDVPSSPVAQTQSFDYYNNNNQQEWSSVHSLPSVSFSDVGMCHTCLKSDLESLVKKEETESDVALCSSAHSTPLHNYLLSKDDSDDRQMLMTHSRYVDGPTLNSCLKSKQSVNNKNKKCIKFDASVSGHHGKMQRTGIRRRKFSKRKSELTCQSDSSPEGSPSKEKTKSKLSILTTLGILRSDGNSAKLSKRKRKAKKKNETIEKLLQSKKTFAIDEPCDAVEIQKEENVRDAVEDTKKIISILKKMSDEEKKNSELSQLMANEFNKKPPLIFGGTYPIDEPFESKRNQHQNKNFKMSEACESLNDLPAKNSEIGKKSKQNFQSGRQLKFSPKNENGSENYSKMQYSEDLFTRMSPLKIFKRIQNTNHNQKPEKENNSVNTTGSLNSSVLKPDKNIHEIIASDMKQSSYDQMSNYNTSNNRRERRDSTLSSGSRYSTSNLSVPRKPSVKENSKSETKTETKPSSQAGKTWLGGIFSRLLPKAPNQMILPDDKNPTIVWDEVQKRWVNKDSNDDDETNTPLAPPTDMELMGPKSSEKPTVPVSNSMPPVATSPVNRFQRPKTRGMRQNYVDILNNSGATTKTNVPPEALFPNPLEQTAMTNMFIPPPAPSENSPELENSNSYSNSGIEQQEQPQAISSAPLMFDPAEFESRRSNIPSQKHMIGRTGRRTYPT